jgi:hypothetical protein
MHDVWLTIYQRFVLVPPPLQPALMVPWTQVDPLAGIPTPLALVVGVMPFAMGPTTLGLPFLTGPGVEPFPWLTPELLPLVVPAPTWQTVQAAVPWALSEAPLWKPSLSGYAVPTGRPILNVTAVLRP